MPDQSCGTAQAGGPATLEYAQACLDRVVGKIRASGSALILQKGDILGHEQLFYLESGKLVLCLNNPRGEPISLFYHTKGQLVSFLPLLIRCFPLDKHLFKKKLPADMFHIKALTRCSLLPVDNEWFMKNLLRDESVSALVIYSCIVNLVTMYARAYNCPILSNAQRICRMILFHTEDSEVKVIPSYLTHAEISSHLSIHPVTVAKIFGKLRARGIIRKIDGAFMIDKLDELRAIADGVERISY